MPAINVAIRADASNALGFGHVVRCLALADAITARGGQVYLVSRALPATVREWVESGGVCVITLPEHDDAMETIRALDGKALDWIVVDHYSLDARWETAVRPVAKRLLVIDDMPGRAHDCDLLLDQSGVASAAPVWSVPSSCRRLIGPVYALVRDEFRRARGRSEPRPGRVERVLVFIGGGDIGNWTEVAVRACIDAGVEAGKADVVVGAGHQDLATIQQLCASAGFTCHVQTSRMAQLMERADLAVGAAGSGSWERCAVGLPAVAFAVAANQNRVLELLTANGAVLPIEGRPDSRVIAEMLIEARQDPDHVRQVSEAAWHLVDGCGADRVCDAMEVVA